MKLIHISRSMDDKNIENLQARTESKLRYAEIHLNELKEQESLVGSDFERTHQESFLFHLLELEIHSSLS